VLLLGPGLLILDEPMTGLDADSRALVRGAIDALLADGCAIVAVEHDLSLAGYADRILYLRDGRVYDTP
jgi:ABC-type multidrug transport system ATPase subunit